MTTADATWNTHTRAIRRAKQARARTIERARRHLKALDACSVTLGVTRLRILELAAASAAPVTTRAHATATAATRGTRRAT